MGQFISYLYSYVKPEPNIVCNTGEYWDITNSSVLFDDDFMDEINTSSTDSLLLPISEELNEGQNDEEWV